MASQKRHLRSKTKNSPIPIIKTHKSSTSIQSQPIQSTSQTPQKVANNFSEAQLTTENRNITSQQGGTENKINNFDTLNDGILTMDQFMKLMATAMQDLSNQLKILTNSLNTYRAESEEIKRQLNEVIVDLKDFKANNLLLKAEINKIHQNEAKYMLTIHGVPNNVDEMEALKKIGRLLEVEVAEHHVADVYRINTKNITTAQPMVIKFTNKITRNSFVANRKNRSIFSCDIGINTDKKQIYVNEYLTKNAMQLLNHAKILKKEFSFKFVWAKNGIIYAKENEKSELFKIENEKVISAIIHSINNEAN
jgi:Baculovirus FP protein